METTETTLGIVASTRGFSIDYGYAANGCEKQIAFEFGKILDDQEPGIAVHKRTNNTFGVSIGCIPTKQKDNINRNIRIYLTIDGLTEEKSRDILLFYLERWDQWTEATEPFLQAFHWNRKSTEQDTREWEVDFQIIRNIIAGISHAACPDKLLQLSDRWELSNNPINRNKLLNLLQKHTFSASSGFKIVVTGPAPSRDSYEQLRQEADRYLWTGGRNEELKDREPSETSNGVDNKKKVSNTIALILLIVGMVLILLGLIPVWEKKPIPSKNSSWEQSSQIQQTPTQTPPTEKNKPKQENLKEEQTSPMETLTYPVDSGKSVISPSP